MPQRLLLAIVTLLCVLLSAPASGGVLDGHAGAFVDSGVTWTGSTSFSNGAGVDGFVDWTVFAPGDFPFAGYVQPANEFVYAYQVFSTGTDSISSLFVSLSNPADNIGDFDDLPGHGVIGTSLNPAVKAEWRFSGLPASTNSVGLAYSSTKAPQDLFGVAVGGGHFAFAMPLPSPSPGGDVPEPATLALLATGGPLALLRRRR